MSRKKIFLVGGARPNFMKLAPLYPQLAREADVRIVHTGQHYDRAMSEVFFQQLGLPEPHISLQVGSGSHASQTARILERFEAALSEQEPHAVVVVGDVNSTLAAALAVSKVTLRNGARPLLAHVEAGLRSRDRMMPEEINRVLTDAVSDVLFTTEADAGQNLVQEGIAPWRIHFVGNVMIDCLVRCLPAIRERRVWESFGVTPFSYGLVTLHRPANVDDPGRLARIAGALRTISERLPVIFPVHPRTKARLLDAGLTENGSLHIVEPIGYLEFMSLLCTARLVLTDSGGIQDESTFLNIPCLTLRGNTERPVTITHGTNRLVGNDPLDLVGAVNAVLAEERPEVPHPPLWDGHAAERIARIVSDVLDTAGAQRPVTVNR
jgi:UDP-N-acetylglucosamine 2-epimerase (non-hydrolysing)